MSKNTNPPFKTPVKISAADKAQDFQKKLFGESCKKIIEGFVAGHVPYSFFLCNIGQYAETYCNAVGRSEECTCFSDESDDTDEMDDDDLLEKYPNTQRDD